MTTPPPKTNGLDPADAKVQQTRAVADVERIREDFPALSRRHHDNPVAYFDGPGGTQVPRVVVNAMAEYLYHHNANTHWAYPTSVETDALLAQARATCADFLNAQPSEVAFGANMTTLTFHLSRSLGRRWGRGDEVVVTELDHHANVDPWRALHIERGVTLRTVPVDPTTGTLDQEALAAAIGPQTRLVAIGAASNALGTINDIKGVAELARAHGALVFVDAVHFAAHQVVDVAEIGCDFLACSAYKFYGPHVGILFGRKALIEGLSVPKLEPAPEQAPDRLETGTLNHEGIVGVAAAVEYLASLTGYGSRRERLEHVGTELAERGHRQVERLWRGLTVLPRVTLYGPPPEAPRTSTVSFSIEGRSSSEIAAGLAEEGLFVSHGDFYASTLIARLGLEGDGLVRVGCAIYTTDEEIERLLHAIRRFAA